MIRKVKFKNIFAVLCMTLGILAFTSINVYAGGPGGMGNGTGTTPPPKEGGDVHGGSIGGIHDGSGSGSNSGGTSSNHNGGKGGSGGSNETPTTPTPSFYNYTDDWGN